MMIVGYNDGSVVLTNPKNMKSKPLNSNYFPQEKGLVIATTITAIKVTPIYARCIIGFSNGCFCVFGLWFKKDGRPTNNKHPLTIDLSEKGSKFPPRITAIGIVNEGSIAVALSDNTMKIIRFHPDLKTCPLPKNQKNLREIISFNKGVAPTIPCLSEQHTAAILVVPDQFGNIQHHVYVLTKKNQLQLFVFDQAFQFKNVCNIVDNVARIVPSTFGTTKMAYITMDGNVWLAADPSINTASHNIQIPGGKKSSNGSSAITLHGDTTIHYATIVGKDTHFDTLQTVPPPQLLHHTSSASLIQQPRPSGNPNSPPSYDETIAQSPPRPIQPTTSSTSLLDHPQPPGEEEDDEVVYVGLDQFHV